MGDVILKFIVSNYTADFNQGEIIDIQIAFNANSDNGDSANFSTKITKADLTENQELGTVTMNDITTIALNKLKSYVASANN